MVSDASTQRFPRARFDELRNILMERMGMLKLDFSQLYTSIPLLRLELKTKTKNRSCQITKIQQQLKHYLHKLVDEQLEAGLVYPNSSSKWSYATNLVPKPGPEEWRFTVDLRPVNRCTFSLRFLMPYIEAESDKSAGANSFSILT